MEKTRRAMWERLGEELDLLVVGGGINGAGIARDAVRRGLKVAVVEMNDLAFGTSSRSSKLIHGGLRYLEHYEFGLVFESVSERGVLLNLAPHLVTPLGFLFPIFHGSPQSLTMIRTGMWVYDILSLFRAPKTHRNLSPSQLAREEPILRQDGLKGAPLYYDAATDDARMTLESAIDAAEHGATIATWAKVERFLISEGKAIGAVVRDVLGGETKEVRAKLIINATGPWADRTLALSSGDSKPPLLRTTKGVHIVVDSKKLPLHNAVVCFHPIDKRVLFALPWGDRTYIGTTDTDDATDPALVHATRSDIDYLLANCAAYFPDTPLRASDVIATWAGLRPLINESAGREAGASESQVSREHKIVSDERGIISIAGGKLTTFRRMSAEVVDVATRALERSGGLVGRVLAAPLRATDPMPGASDWPRDRGAYERGLAERTGLDLATIRHLVSTYGTRAERVVELADTEPSLKEPLIAGRPEIAAQVVYAARDEFAATICDVLIRRTQIFFRDYEQGLGCVDRVARLMAEELAWDDSTIRRELERYRSEVALSRKWRESTAAKPLEAHP